MTFQPLLSHFTHQSTEGDKKKKKKKSEITLRLGRKEILYSELPKLYSSRVQKKDDETQKETERRN